jgi:ABC-type protease/lipase transport system fused ATPase/permease subunit
MVKWIVKNTPFKYLNQKLQLKNKIEKADLHQLRQEMTSSEIDHLIGFVFVAAFALVKFYKTEWLFGLTIMAVNILMNLNPSLLQQQNKRRIDRLIKKM